MDQSSLLRYLAETLDRLSIPYLVTGSTATITYGEPRFTNGVDIVIDMRKDQVRLFCAAFPQDRFYVSQVAVEQAVQARHQFNIIHPESELKADLIIASESDFDRSRLTRGRRLAIFPDYAVAFASPEDVIIKKLEYYRDGGSEKHMRDIASVLKVQGEAIDCGYIAKWAARLGLQEIWQAMLDRSQDTT